MIPTFKTKLKNISQNPATRKALHSLKPEKSIWGILGVLVFIILPEVIGFIWGSELTEYAKNSLATALFLMERIYFKSLIWLFEDGGSWINLSLGVGLLVWLFF